MYDDLDDHMSCSGLHGEHRPTRFILYSALPFLLLGRIVAICFCFGIGEYLAQGRNLTTLAK